MAAQKGSAYLLKIGDGGGPEAFTTIAGARTVNFTRTRTPVDTTNAGSSELARELLTGAGMKQGSISFDGVFTDNATDSTLETDFDAGTLRNFEIVVPDFGTYTGAFVITSLVHNGSYQEGGSFSIALESGDLWAFVAV